MAKATGGAILRSIAFVIAEPDGKCFVMQINDRVGENVVYNWTSNNGRLIANDISFKLQILPPYKSALYCIDVTTVWQGYKNTNWRAKTWIEITREILLSFIIHNYLPLRKMFHVFDLYLNLHIKICTTKEFWNTVGYVRREVDMVERMKRLKWQREGHW